MSHTTEEFREELNRTTTDMIRNAERSLAVARAIGDRAVAVNRSVHREVLGQIQLAELGNAVLSLSTMFDRPPRAYPTRSIPSMIQAIERNAEDLTLLDRTALEEYLVAAGEDRSATSGLAASELLRRFVQKYRGEIESPDVAEALEELRTRRDKRLAHNEAIPPGGEDRLTWAHLDLILAAAKKFAIAAGPALADLAFGRSYRLSKDHEMAGRQMHALMDDLQIER